MHVLLDESKALSQAEPTSPLSSDYILASIKPPYFAFLNNWAGIQFNVHDDKSNDDVNSVCWTSIVCSNHTPRLIVYCGLFRTGNGSKLEKKILVRKTAWLATNCFHPEQVIGQFCCTLPTAVAYR